MTTAMPPAPPAPLEPPPNSGNPVQLSIVHAATYSRGLAILGVPFFLGRLLALIPVLIALYFIGIGAFFTAFAMQFAVLFTGRYPEGAHRFVTGYLRLAARSSAWALGLTDTYPGFSIQPSPASRTTPHTVQVSIAHVDKYSRGLGFLGCILFIGRMIALIPVFFILYFLRLAAGLTAWIMQFAVLFTGRYPEGAHTFITGYVRLATRTESWLFGVTDKYPGVNMQP